MRLFFLFLVLIALVIEWVFTCGIVYLITLCFGLTFSWSVATGIWLISILLYNIVKSSSSK